MRRHPVHYLEEQDFTNHLGNEEDAAAAIRRFAESYTPSDTFKLVTAEGRKLNKALAILEGEPDEDGLYALEDEDFKVLQKTTIVMMENLTANGVSFLRSAPFIEDIFNACPTVKPEAPSNVTPISEAGD